MYAAMSENLQSDTNKNKRDRSEQQQTQWNIVEQSSDVVDKQQLLIERAKNTFQELYRTLENEQSKLLSLEERRKQLQEEMLLLKAEIEKEKQSFDLNLVQSVAENLTTLNNDSTVCDQGQRTDEYIQSLLYTCYEEDEEQQLVTARNVSEKIKEESTIEDHVQCISSELQNVLAECITE